MRVPLNLPGLPPAKGYIYRFEVRSLEMFLDYTGRATERILGLVVQNHNVVPLELQTYLMNGKIPNEQQERGLSKV